MSTKKVTNKSSFNGSPNKSSEGKRKFILKIVGFVVFGGVIVLVAFGIWRLYYFESSPSQAWMRDGISVALQNAFNFGVAEESSDTSGRYIRLESDTGLSFYYYYVPGQIDISPKEWFQIKPGSQEQQYYNFGHVLYKLHEDEIDESVQKNNGYITKKSVEAPYHHEVRFSNVRDKEAFLSDLLEIQDMKLAKKACEETLEEEESRGYHNRVGCSKLTPVYVNFGGGQFRDVWE